MHTTTKTLLAQLTPTLLGTQTFTASGSGSSGVPSVAYNIPAGKNRVMVISILTERNHGNTANSNWPAGADGQTIGQIPVVQVFAGSVRATSLISWTHTHNSPSGDNNVRFNLNYTTQYISDSVGLPTGPTIITFPNLNLPENAGDEMIVVISVFQNASSIVSYNGRTSQTGSTSNSISYTGTVPSTPVGTTAANVVYLSTGQVSQQGSSLGIASGWNSIANLNINNTNGTATYAGTAVVANENDGIRLATTYRSGLTAAPSITYTRDSTTAALNFGTYMFNILPLARPALSGTVYRDNNGLTGGIDGGGLGGGVWNTANVFWVNAVRDGVVIATAPVNASGVFTFPAGGALAEGDVVTFQLSTTQGTLNSPPPARILPPGITTVGESISSGASDGTPDGQFTRTIGTTSSTNNTTNRFGVSAPVPVCNVAKSFSRFNVSNTPSASQYVHSGNGVYSFEAATTTVLRNNDNSNTLTVAMSAVTSNPSRPLLSNTLDKFSWTTSVLSTLINSTGARTSSFTFENPTNEYVYRITDLLSTSTTSFDERVRVTGYDLNNNIVYPVFFNLLFGAEVVETNLVRDGSTPGTNTQGAASFYFPVPVKRFVLQQEGVQNYVNYFIETCPATISGTVFNDANGNTVINALENGTTADTNLYVYAVDNNGIIVDSSRVASNGTYSLVGSPLGAITLVLSPNQYALNTNTNTTPINTNLPATWLNTGENGENNSGSGDGTPDGRLTIIVNTTDNTNKNFGLQRIPIADSITASIQQPLRNDTIPLNGIGLNPPLMSGIDAEDGAYLGAIGTVHAPRGVNIGSLPTNGDLYYDGVLVTISDINLATLFEDPSLFSIVLSGRGYDSTSFTYAYVDGAGAQSQFAPYSINWEFPLPVKLISFDAYKKGTVAELLWSTASEKNSRGFEVERSTDGSTFTKVGFVASRGEGGNSTVKLDYTFTDYAPTNGRNLYRLKQTDFDGKYDYSTIKAVIFDKGAGIIIFPNPTTEMLNITGLLGNEKLTIYNSAGVLVYQQVAAESQMGVSFKHLSEGLYLLKVESDDGTIATYKIVKTN